MIDHNATARLRAGIDSGGAQNVADTRDARADDEDVLAGGDPLAHRFGKEVDLTVEMLDRAAFEHERLDGAGHPSGRAISELDRPGEEQRRVLGDALADLG